MTTETMTPTLPDTDSSQSGGRTAALHMTPPAPAADLRATLPPASAAPERAPVSLAEAVRAGELADVPPGIACLMAFDGRPYDDDPRPPAPPPFQGQPHAQPQPRFESPPASIPARCGLPDESQPGFADLPEAYARARREEGQSKSEQVVSLLRCGYNDKCIMNILHLKPYRFLQILRSRRFRRRLAAHEEFSAVQADHAAKSGAGPAMLLLTHLAVPDQRPETARRAAGAILRHAERARQRDAQNGGMRERGNGKRERPGGMVTLPTLDLPGELGYEDAETLAGGLKRDHASTFPGRGSMHGHASLPLPGARRGEGVIPPGMSRLGSVTMPPTEYIVTAGSTDLWPQVEITLSPGGMVTLPTIDLPGELGFGRGGANAGEQKRDHASTGEVRTNGAGPTSPDDDGHTVGQGPCMVTPLSACEAVAQTGDLAAKPACSVERDHATRKQAAAGCVHLRQPAPSVPFATDAQAGGIEPNCCGRKYLHGDAWGLTPGRNPVSLFCGADVQGNAPSDVPARRHPSASLRGAAKQDTAKRGADKQGAAKRGAESPLGRHLQDST